MNTPASGADDALPLPDYDQLSIGELEHRIRGLDEEQLNVLIEHEQRHANRTAVELLLVQRIEQLQNGAQPTPGGPGIMPSTAEPPRRGSPVSPATATEPRHNPPHGTPQQPGKGPRMGPG